VVSTGSLGADDWPVTVPLAEPLDADRLCQQYAHRVYRFAAMVARGEVEAEDLAQEALIRAIRNLAKFDPDRGSLETWLWRIVVNTARDAGRVAGRRQALWERLTERHSEGASTESLALDRLTDAELLRAVRLLQRRDRALIALRFGADLDYAAVGRASGLSVAAATMAIHRALAKLRRNLEKQP
jgi:RNA polymerase sigma-70 factor, ECF subfamily